MIIIMEYNTKTQTYIHTKESTGVCTHTKTQTNIHAKGHATSVLSHLIKKGGTQIGLSMKPCS